jgi:hypothetical protein
MLLSEARTMTVHQLRREAWGLGRDDPHTAIALLEVALTRSPADVDVLWQKALFEYAVPDLVATEATLKRLLAVRSIDTAAMSMLVKVLRRLGKTEEASRWYRRNGELGELLGYGR